MTLSQKLTAPKRSSSAMQVWLGRSESEEWSDDTWRTSLCDTLAVSARAKGRRYFEVYASDGLLLHKGSV